MISSHLTWIELSHLLAILGMLDQTNGIDDALLFLQKIIHVVEVTMDGTSGAICYFPKRTRPWHPSTITSETSTN